MSARDPIDFVSAPDYTVTTSPGALPAFPAGDNGILVTAHPSNTVVIRISGADVAAGQGQPLFRSSYIFATNDASRLHAVAESAGTAKLCMTAV